MHVPRKPIDVPGDAPVAADAASLGAALAVDAVGPDAATQGLLDDLANQPESRWLEHGRALVLRGAVPSARHLFEAARRAFPQSTEVRLALAGVEWQLRHVTLAETQLLGLLGEDPSNAAAAFMLSRIYRDSGRMRAVEEVMLAWFDQSKPDVELTLQAVDLLNDCGRTRAAAAFCERLIAAGSADARLHAYAGMLLLQTGDFERSRQRYRFALTHSALAPEWEAPYGLSSATPYADRADPDFALFEGLLTRNDLSARARGSLLFALAKAHDDVGDFAAAADRLREGHRILHANAAWSRKQWRRAVDARLGAQPLPRRSPAAGERVPIFIVGAPRSGTTLVAELLARSVDVCNRGESSWLPALAQPLAQSARPDVRQLDAIAATYLAQLFQDDGAQGWVIDKRPLNFMHLDLIGALFPQARIIHCNRDARDTALSIWMQNFAGREHDFSHDFGDIEAVLHGSARLILHARKAGAAMRSVDYASVVTDPAAVIRSLADWIGLPRFDIAERVDAPRVISTSSAWQARQPVHTRSLGRWRSYAPFVPELEKIG